MSENTLKLIPLGGLGEIGKNMMLMEYGENIIVIDAGLMFPENYMLGIDIVIPDISYLLEHKDKVKGIIITHGHEDHIGGLPYVLPQVNVPIYATKLTRGLIEVKLKEHKLLKATSLHTIQPGDILDLGPFHVEFFRVCHSIPDGVGLAVETPVGLVVHSGDFKFDHSPVDGRLTDFAKLAELGGRGVLVLLSDSTNAESPGYTHSEQEIGETFDRIFSKAKGRVIVTTFASNISRIQQVIETAERHNRRVGVVGRSMVNNVKMAVELGYLNVSPDMLLTIGEINRLPPRKVVMVCTGSQGEPTSALVRMASDEYKSISIRPGDTVIVSATPIPGNEELINHTLNNLFRLGADVYYDELLDVHVSGHASREEQKLMINLIKPRFFVPIHGDYRHLVLHAQMAQQLGIPTKNILVIESGQVLEFDGDEGWLGEEVAGGYVFVDGLGVGDVGQVVLRDRQHLSRDGFLIAVVAMDEKTGELLAEPDIISRGFVYIRESEELIEQAKEQVAIALEKSTSPAVVSAKIKETLGEFLYEQTKRRPMILPVVIEV
ncbi:MAG: ribonuclease J [Anaerolineae bacterium]|nr:ribonuclease J [Anaerolineae bacterium]